MVFRVRYLSDKINLVKNKNSEEEKLGKVKEEENQLPKIPSSLMSRVDIY
jgi:hypothetical protein